MTGTLRYYFVANIDALGQSIRLLELNSIPITPQDEEEAVSVLSDTAGFIMKLRRSFTHFYTEHRNAFPSTYPLDSLSDTYKALAQETVNQEPLISSFSDTIIIAVPLDAAFDHALSISGILAALYAICGTYLAALGEGRPIRCGIDVGVAIELPTDAHEVYGEAIVKAHRLESNFALYPRVVIGNSLYDYIDSVQHLTSTGDYTGVASRLAEVCKSIITKDHNHFYILDVIGAGIRSDTSVEIESLVQKAYEFVVQAHTDFTAKNNLLLASRYGSLRNYFESRLELWGIKPRQQYS